MPRLFDGVNDEIRCSIGNCNTGFGTLAAIIRRNANGTMTTFGLHESGGTDTISMRFALTGALQWSTAGSVAGIATAGMTSASGWGLVAVTKATGTVAPRGHRYLYSDNSWVHADSGTTLANGSGAGSGTVRFANRAGSEWFDGDILVAGVYNAVLTDAQIEQLPFSLLSWFAPSSLRGLWLMDQSLTTQAVVDWTGGGANQSAITGTAIATNNTPVFGYGHRVIHVNSHPAAAAPAATRRRLLMGVGR